MDFEEARPGTHLDKRSFVIGAIVAVALFSLPSYLQHYLYFMTGQVGQVIIQRRWDLVALNVFGFLLFMLPLAYRRKADWKSMGVYAAFIVSLFVEMYGIPLTVYLSSAAITDPAVNRDIEYLVEFSVLGQSFGMDLWTIVGGVITLVGAVVVALGWITIYRHTSGDDEEGDGSEAEDMDGELVTSGIYAYSRHPQYVGIILIVVGWFIGFPTILTTVILPVLVYFYYKAAVKEEKEVMEELDDPSEYEEYRKSTPMFV